MFWLPRVAGSNALCMLPAPGLAMTLASVSGAGPMVMLVARLFKVEALESDVTYVSGTVIVDITVSGTVIAGANVSGIAASAGPNEFKQGATRVAHEAAAFCMLPPRATAAWLMPAAHLFLRTFLCTVACEWLLWPARLECVCHAGCRV